MYLVKKEMGSWNQSQTYSIKHAENEYINHCNVSIQIQAATWQNWLGFRRPNWSAVQWRLSSYGKWQNLTEAVKKIAQGTKVTPIKLVADFISISEELRKEFPKQIQWEKRRDCNNIKTDTLNGMDKQKEW